MSFNALCENKILIKISLLASNEPTVIFQSITYYRKTRDPWLELFCKVPPLLQIQSWSLAETSQSENVLNWPLQRKWVMVRVPDQCYKGCELELQNLSDSLHVCLSVCLSVINLHSLSVKLCRVSSSQCRG